MSAPLEWLVLGGGIHGTHLSHVLLHRAQVPSAQLRVLDPHPTPMEVFWRHTAATGMRFLRSPGVHHLALDPFALHHFSKHRSVRTLPRFAPPYHRPSLALFRAHCEHLCCERKLTEVRLRGTALRLERDVDGYRVETDQGVLRSRRVVLSLGQAEQLCRPDWATSEATDAHIPHMFAPEFSRSQLQGARSIAIIGGGVSAVQLACSLVGSQCAQVTMIARHAPKVAQFDSDPAWLGPKAMSGFLETKDYAVRRKLLQAARHRGSIPPEGLTQLRQAQRAGTVQWMQAEVVAAHAVEQQIELLFAETETPMRFDRVVLATGFLGKRPGGAMLEHAVQALELPCAECGFPLVPPNLEWAPGLFVTGSLAELELGPTARNIAGARAAGLRIAG